MKRFAFSLVAIVILSQFALAQTTDERRAQRRAFLEGVLKTVIESQMPPSAEGSPPGMQFIPPIVVQPGHGMPGHGHRPPGPGPHVGPPVISTPELNRLRLDLAAFSQEASGLIDSLRLEERYSPAIRPLLADAVRLKSAAEVLLGASHRIRHERELAGDVQVLDQYYRTLSHRLRQVPNLGRATIVRLDAMETVDGRLLRLMGLEPQIDREQLESLVMAVQTNLFNLTSDVATDVKDYRMRGGLIMEARQVRMAFDRITMLIAQNAKNAEIIDQYQTASKAWSALAAKLRGVDSVSISRQLVQMDKLNVQLHEVLWLPLPLDRETILHYATGLRSEIEILLGDISLAQLLSLPEPQKVITHLAELRKLADQFVGTVASSASEEDLRWDYRLLEVEWQGAKSRLGPIYGGSVAEHITGISETLKHLRASLRIPPAFDREMAIALAAEVDELAVQLAGQMQDRVGRNIAYPAPTRVAVASDAHGLHTVAHQLHEALASGQSQDALQSTCVKLAAQWEKMAMHYQQIKPEDRAAMSETVERFVPKLAKLEIILAY